MTKEDIIKTAFQVWGRDLYRRPSLSVLAKALKVSKPALYRHFLCKEALTQAMFTRFFDDYADSIRSDLDKASKMEDVNESLLIVFRAIANFYAQNCHALIFSLMNVYEKKLNKEIVYEEIKARGVNADVFMRIFQDKYDNQPGLLQMIFATLSFYMANFHKNNNSMDNSPTNKQINDIISLIVKILKHGLGFSPEQIKNIDFEKLEKLDEINIQSETAEITHKKYYRNRLEGRTALFKAVAEAVAEAGPWEASMEMVAKKMGISKSSLYGHFKDKKDMLRSLFISEFKRIMDFARQGVSLSGDTAEQLYLGIYSIAVYLRSRPEILIAIDWIRTRRLDLGKSDKDHEIFRLFEDIDIESLRGRPDEEKQLTSGWILFLLLAVLPKTETEDGGLQSNINIRVLYRFITLGLGGFIK